MENVNNFQLIYSYFALCLPGITYFIIQLYALDMYLYNMVINWYTLIKPG